MNPTSVSRFTVGNLRLSKLCNGTWLETQQILWTGRPSMETPWDRSLASHLVRPWGVHGSDSGNFRVCLLTLDTRKSTKFFGFVVLAGSVGPSACAHPPQDIENQEKEQEREKKQDCHNHVTTPFQIRPMLELPIHHPNLVSQQCHAA